MRRYTIRSLMALVILAAVGLAALRSANELWAGLMLLVALATIGVTLLGTIISRGRERAWWAGFAFFAGSYLLLAEGPWLSPWLRPQLGTTHLLNELHSRLMPQVSGDTVEAQQVAAVTRAASLDVLLRLGHSLFALLAGLAGGIIAGRFRARREGAER
jgi:hypothetical protein